MPKAYLDFKYDKSSLMESMVEQPFTITSRADNNNVYVTVGDWLYSTDGGLTYHEKEYAGILCTLNTGDTVMLIGNHNAFNNETNDAIVYANNYFDVSGNIMSLLSTSYTSSNQVYANTFKGLFINSCVVDASNLILPATTLGGNCYQNMFKGCSYLKIPPKLPATTLASYCYASMFDGCSNLVQAPELPATTLAVYCYSEMFSDCTSLVQAPVLPATTLAGYCYDYMFAGCYNLSMPPALSATTLAVGCYIGMFEGCSALTLAPELPATTLPVSCYTYMFKDCSNLSYIKIHAEERDESSLSYWVQNVADSGVFIKSPFAYYDIDSVHGVPIGWTVYNIGDDIPDIYNVTTYVSPADRGYIVGGGYYSRGSTVTLKAIAYDGYVFTRWEDENSNILSGSAIYTFTVNRPITIYGKFVTESSLTEYESEYFAIESEEDNNEVYMCAYYDEPEFTLHYKIDNGQNNVQWQSMLCKYYDNYMYDNYGNMILYKPTLIATLNAGQKLYLGIDSEIFGRKRFDVKKNHKISGNILSLIAYSASENSTDNVFYYDSNFEVPDGCFESAFSSPFYDEVTRGYYNITLTDAYNLKLPATVVGRYAYFSMFENCTSLLRAPKILPATTLAEDCYGNMFFNCTSLLTAPELPATTLAPWCYDCMFEMCKSLVEAPELPATTLAEECYCAMFERCESLVEAPELPATTLAPWCYNSMFRLCINLIYAPELPATTLVEGCYYRMFETCQGLLEAPVLPADTLAPSCYYAMFEYCTFSRAPILFAENVPDNAYRQMFCYNPNLNYIYILAESYNESSEVDESSLLRWVKDVAPTGTFIKHPDTEYLIDNINGVPPGWTVQNYDGSPVAPRYIVELNNSNTDAGSISIYTMENNVRVDKGTKAKFIEGTTVYIEAIANDGFVFTKWQASNGMKLSELTTYSFVVTGNINLTAIWNVYTPIYYTVSVQNTNVNMGTVTGTGSKRSGEVAFINAVATQGYEFDKYIDLNTGQVYKTSSLTMTVTRNITLQVYWKDLSASYEHKYFTIEALQNNCSVYIDGIRTDSYLTVNAHVQGQYKLGSESFWRNFELKGTIEELGTKLADLNIGETISIRNCFYEDYAYINFIVKKEYKVYGNVMSLKYEYTSSSSTDNYYVYNGAAIRGLGFRELLAEYNRQNGGLSGGGEYIRALKDASNLILPATTLTKECYKNMFRGCRGLTKTPVLPATTLAEGCYKNMFVYCIALTTAPNLPATTLTKECYNSMFWGCISMIIAPVLRASTLAESCYYEMFKECHSLNYIKCLATNISATNCTNNWVQNISSSGTFVKNSSTTWTTGNNGIPSGWTVTTASS